MKKLNIIACSLLSIVSLSSFADSLTYDRDIQDGNIVYTYNQDGNGEYAENYDSSNKVYQYIPRLRGWVMGPQANQAGMTNTEYCVSQGAYHPPKIDEIDNLNTLLNNNDSFAISVAESLNVDRIGGSISLTQDFQQDETHSWAIVHSEELSLGIDHNYFVYKDKPDYENSATLYICVPN
ncbi:hypothetical protein [Shewanella violacea]|uniref:Uncharacterized protein n=1 Tax=Shewanella violacea (strain JCM 10179 / CIP 106290 / LMG 19151 / DSS12) TaxID=637905 RepID=D4ZMA7_SHEVD|nr:hypothetical protein [Shewanella violacea]BAJ02806.1 hypothetical protein SVI_2835 [Shewanella violacea DSS12]